MNNRISRVMTIILSIVALVAGYQLYDYLDTNNTQEVIIDEYRDDISNNEPLTEKKKNKLKNVNDDFVGWVRIDGTKINYPVMQSSKSNPEYYLDHNIYKEYNKAGTVFAGANCDVNNSDNLILYGHKMKIGTMFGTLEKYEDKSFYKKHKYIQLDTMNDYRVFKIVCVLKTQVGSSNEIKYYNMIDFKTKEEYEEFIQAARSAQLYNTNQKTKYGDKYITLSTCEYTQDNGRLVVIGKEVDPEQRIMQETEKGIPDYLNTALTILMVLGGLLILDIGYQVFRLVKPKERRND